MIKVVPNLPYLNPQRNKLGWGTEAALCGGLNPSCMSPASLQTDTEDFLGPSSLSDSSSCPQYSADVSCPFSPWDQGDLVNISEAIFQGASKGII